MAQDFVREALEGMARVGAPRQPAGTGGYALGENTSVVESAPLKTPRKNTQAGDPAGKNKKNRSQTMVPKMTTPAERLGPRFAISVKTPFVQLHESSATLANGRIMAPSIVRTRSFKAGGTVDLP